MEQKFNVGEIVALKSTPNDLMTIIKDNKNGYVECIFFSKESHRNHTTVCGVKSLIKVYNGNIFKIVKEISKPNTKEDFKAIFKDMFVDTKNIELKNQGFHMNKNNADSKKGIFKSDEKVIHSNINTENNYYKEKEEISKVNLLNMLKEISKPKNETKMENTTPEIQHNIVFRHPSQVRNFRDKCIEIVRRMKSLNIDSEMHEYVDNLFLYIELGTKEKDNFEHFRISILHEYYEEQFIELKPIFGSKGLELEFNGISEYILKELDNSFSVGEIVQYNNEIYYIHEVLEKELLVNKLGKKYHAEKIDKSKCRKANVTFGK